MMENPNHSGWCYRAEGNCNMIFFSKSRRVYRILKIDVDDACRQEDSHNENSWRDVQRTGFLGDGATFVASRHSTRAKYKLLVQYSACVMERLYLDYMSVPRMKLVSVSFLKDLTLGINNKRPEKRLNKEISLCPMVLDIPDYAFLPTPFHHENTRSFMFELKAGSVARSYRNILSQTSSSEPCPPCTTAVPCCYFCINRSLDHENKASRICRYCPQELFSGNGKRMRRCVMYLLEDIACPGSKLRLFQDGLDITENMTGVDDIISLFSPYFHTDDSFTVMEELVALLVKCLTYAKPVTYRNESTVAILSSHPSCPSSSHYLPEGCILDIFANAQYYGAATVGEVQDAYETLQSYIDKDPTLVDKLCIDGPYDTGMWRLSARPDRPVHVSEKAFSAFLVVRDYLIYRTAKDASMLVTFQPRRPNLKLDLVSDSAVFALWDTFGTYQYVCNTAIIDLDLKPFSNMEAYLKKEWAIFDKLNSYKGKDL
ncbi:inositol-pentakisphosphate 2-kinase-like [Watersipora subatra]|uniref:inositol-pentakisphosphate 2-kinase-like n=1 Tax=Watersipora subatra TaxID=2589382 RepID=UPI00355B7482